MANMLKLSFGLVKYFNPAHHILKNMNISKRSFHLSKYLFGTKGIEIKMPSLSPTMTEGTIVKWLKKEGDTISPGDAICEIQTDKAVVFFEMEEEGILAKILLQEDSKDIKIGTPIALMVEPGEDWKDVEIPDAISSSAPSPKPQVSSKVSQPSIVSVSHTLGQSSSKISPAARNLMLKHKVDPNQVKATGPFNVILKEDVLKFISSGGISETKLTEPTPQVSAASSSMVSAQPQKKPAYIDIPLSNMRRTIAKRLTESKTTIPHSYQTMEAQVDAIIKLRKNLKNDGIKVSINDFIIKAAAGALQIVPEVNAIWDGKQAQFLSTIDISVAVATENGLITPIVRSANRLDVASISETVKELAQRAKLGKLKLDEFQGGTFCISNLGMFGIKEFSAVINPPQAAILAVGSSRNMMDEQMNPITTMRATLCYDARIIDDLIAAKFISVLRDYLETPEALMVGSKFSKRQALR